MSEASASGDVQLKVRELLGRATLARARGRHEEALALAEEARGLDDASWEAHELMGDLLVALQRPEPALDSYRRARHHNPDRGLLEEKIGRAALAVARLQRAADQSKALLEGTHRPDRPKRNPGYAALLSLLLPGLGQIYNGEMLKGLAMASGFAFLFALAALAALRQFAASSTASLAAYGPQTDAGGLFSALLSGVAAFWSLLLILLWVYAIGDAAFRASRTMTSDDTGLV